MKPSLKRNALANYFGQGYTILIGIVIYPFYLQYLGAEAYGLVGFFLVLQAWLNLLDIGMTPTLGRQVAHARGQGEGFLELKKLLRSLEIIFFGLGVAVALAIIFGSGWIASGWLQVESLAMGEVAYCIALMGIMVALRWFASLYKSGISGMEAQVWLNTANVMVSSLKFIGVLVVLIWISTAPSSFFEYQLVIGVLEVVVFGYKFYLLMSDKTRIGLTFSYSTLKPLLPFALSIAYTSGIWILITQLDKMLLSNILPLGEYGYFALVAIVAAGVMQISSPIGKALLPRMTFMLAAGNESEMLLLYRKASQVVATVMFSVAGMVAVFSEELLYAWTGDMQAATWAGPVLFWYVLGNGLLAVLAFQYYLQYAHGKLRLHVQMNTVFAIILVPVIAVAAYKFGALGTGITWFAMQCIFFVVCPAVIHARFAPGIHAKWLFGDIFPVFLSTAAGLLLVTSLPVDVFQFSRGWGFLLLLGQGMVVLSISSLGSSAVRQQLFVRILRGR
ncbi:polysaccharide biosynthesis protein [Desulfurispirillum indicum]|uniref:lipopolysaccharide biosynthesis protein n=1 Tax=Desulfurispirillum indicum TaxID=936456 RepID=UPI001CFAC327|nr:oligosaccharide flippase family protein [Desulfurispirillum indicum]UCZ56532.1 polysaccharide biosynthesis protein [Desulfurispirillum indicum]